MTRHRSYRKSAIPENAERVFEGKIFDVYQWGQKLYDGSTATFERISRQDTIVVFPVLPDGTILLIRDSQPDRDTIVTAPAGRMEEGENPEESARRELREETGYEVGKLELLYAYQPYRKMDWVIHVFVGKDCRKVGEPESSPSEKTEPFSVTFEELVEMTVSGEYDKDGFDAVVLRAKLDPAKMAELKKKFAP